MAGAQEQAPPSAPASAASASAPALTLADCLRIAAEKQPALAASSASLASANTQYEALLKLHGVPLMNRDLPIRREQACLGVTIAEAALAQARADNVYAVTRTYFGVLFAREQLRVAEGLTASLRFYQERVSDLVKKGASREWTTSTVDKITLYLRLAETRQFEATRGIGRATAALREALGIAPEAPLTIATGSLPAPTMKIDRQEIIGLALARRAELAQVTAAAEVVALEVDAQGKTCLPTARTFAAGTDLHAQPVPQGLANSEYRPGAISLEMPTMLAGSRSYRVERARDLSARAAAVVDKARNLVALEADDAYLKWEENARKLPLARDAAEAGSRLSQNTRKDFTASQKVRIEDILTNEVLGAQAQGSYNETLFQQIIALAGLQRATTGAFDAGLVGPSAK